MDEGNECFDGVFWDGMLYLVWDEEGIKNLLDKLLMFGFCFMFGIWYCGCW